MKSIITAMLEEIYLKAHEIATDNKKTKLEKGEYFVTLEQLMSILNSFED